MYARKNRQAIEENIEVFETLKVELAKYLIEDVATEAKVAPATLYFWLSGVTRKPRLDTFLRVAKVLGYRLALSRTGAALVKKHRRGLRAVK